MKVQQFLSEGKLDKNAITNIQGELDKVQALQEEIEKLKEGYDFVETSRSCYLFQVERRETKTAVYSKDKEYLESVRKLKEELDVVKEELAIAYEDLHAARKKIKDSIIPLNNLSIFNIRKTVKKIKEILK